MTLQSRAARTVIVGEDADDLRGWLRGLTGCPKITHTQLASCAAESHNGDRPTWFFVEADADAGVARRRCVACGDVAHVLDSAAHWTHPAMFACATCGQSIMELAAGLHSEADPETGALLVDWLALGVRCVDCGQIAGVSDLHVPRRAIDEVAAHI